MSYMFHEVNNLIELDISNFNTSNVTNMEYLFAGMTSIESLNISNFNITNVVASEYIFTEIKNYVTIIIGDVAVKTFVEERLKRAERTANLIISS